MEQREVYIRSTMDGTMQPSLFYEAAGTDKRPLLVGLHTWSYNRFNQINNMLPYSKKYNFNLLLPEFRGNNLKSNSNCTQACGSEYAKQDIKDAIDYFVAQGKVDAENIFLLGLSGGGHMSLLMAGYCPEYFKAVGAFVPITDLKQWVIENEHYREHVMACCSYDEGEMTKRSPISYLNSIAKSNTKLFHGKYDPVVPFTHSMEFYKKMLAEHPKAHVYLDIFDGGHQVDMELAFHWILSQYHKIEKTAVTG